MILPRILKNHFNFFLYPYKIDFTKNLKKLGDLRWEIIQKTQSLGKCLGKGQKTQSLGKCLGKGQKTYPPRNLIKFSGTIIKFK